MAGVVAATKIATINACFLNVVMESSPIVHISGERRAEPLVTLFHRVGEVTQTAAALPLCLKGAALFVFYFHQPIPTDGMP